MRPATGGAVTKTARCSAAFRLALFTLFFSLFTLNASAQTKKINALKSQRTQIERGIKQSKTKLNQTKHETVKKEQTADFLEDQLQSRLNYIHQLETEIDTLEHRVERLEGELADLDSQVTEKKGKYIQSLRYARNSSDLRNPLLFIFSSESFPQVYRRMRYAREFAALQKNLGLQLMAKQNEARDKRNELLEVKQQMSGTVQEVIRQRKQLAAEHSVVQANVVQLKKKQKEIEKQVSEQQKQLTALNKKIDELIAIEIEKARKRAEEEARRKREAEERAKAANSANTKGSKSGKSSGKGKKSTKTSSKAPTKWLTAEDKQLNGSLEQNKGRLPVPITGPYRIERRFGLTHVTSTVVLDNKGVNYMGQSGARARAIFDGEVSAVFQLGSMKNILIRHGSYISVYCNLSSIIVQRGQKVKARDILGTVAPDSNGNFVLHFQLRKETAKLNPEHWIGK
ncbi:MAG: peptidoglycan DD-metalloendopeptidase family protein [Bacteroidales bacterium]|nr:peptidoglycan DD-metalloendopeptidase family protein [Bacteroidales bacterium]